nr:hypothetical protein [uncultured Methanobrevibacter sp.]
MKKCATIIIFAILLFIAVSAVSAEDSNSTQMLEIDENHDTLNVINKDSQNDTGIVKSNEVNENTLKEETE